MRRRDWLLLFVLSSLWSSSFLFAKVAVGELHPLAIVLARVGLAAAVLWPVLLALGYRPPGGFKPWRDFAIMGLLNNVIPFGLIFWGQTRIGSGLASILNATTPLFTVLLAHFLTGDERINANKLAGIALGIGGVAVLIGPAALARADGDLLGQLAVIGAAVSYAGAGIFGKRFSGQQPLVTAAGQLSASTILCLPLALFSGALDIAALPSPVTLLCLAGLALICTALAYIVYFRLLASAGATNLLLVTLLVPVGAIILGVLMLGESFDARQAAGIGLIGLALLAIDGRLLRPGKI